MHVDDMMYTVSVEYCVLWMKIIAKPFFRGTGKKDIFQPQVF